MFIEFKKEKFMSTAVTARLSGLHPAAGLLFSEPTGTVSGSPTAPRTSPGATAPVLTIGRPRKGAQTDPLKQMISTPQLSLALQEHFQEQWQPAASKPTVNATALSILSQAAPVPITAGSRIERGGSSAFSTRLQLTRIQLTPITASPPESQAPSRQPSPSSSPMEDGELSLARYESGKSEVSMGGEMLPFPETEPEEEKVAPAKAPPLTEKKKPPYPLDETSAIVWKVKQELIHKYPHLADLDRSRGPRVDNSFNFKGLPESGPLFPVQEPSPPASPTREDSAEEPSFALCESRESEEVGYDELLDPITAKVWQIKQELCEKYPHLADLDDSMGTRGDNRFNLKGIPVSDFRHAARH